MNKQLFHSLRNHISIFTFNELQNVQQKGFFFRRSVIQQRSEEFETLVEKTHFQRMALHHPPHCQFHMLFKSLGRSQLSLFLIFLIFLRVLSKSQLVELSHFSIFIFKLQIVQFQSLVFLHQLAVFLLQGFVLSVHLRVLKLFQRGSLHQGKLFLRSI